MLQLFFAFGEKCDNRGFAAFVGDFHGALEGFFAVVDDFVRDAFGGVVGHLGANVFHAIVRRILFGVNEQVGIGAGGLRQHFAALVCLAARSAENGDDLLVRIFLLQRLEQRFERKLVVRVVDNSGDGLVRRSDDFHTARHAHVRKALLNRVPADAQKTRARDGAQRIFGIEQACDAQLYRVSAGRSIFFACCCGEFGAFCDIELDAAFDRAHVAGDQVGAVAVDADGEQLRGSFRGCHDLIDVFGADVYHGAFALVENAEFAFEIIFERGVLGG